MKKIISILIAMLSIIGISAFAEGENESHRIMYAVESELVYRDGKISNMYMRPFVYDGSSYIPVRNVVEGMGGTVNYDGTSNSVVCAYKDKSFEVSMTDSRIKVYDNSSFIKIRDMCNELDIKINWYGGLIVVSDEDIQLSDNEVAEYKDKLWYEGYEDKYLKEIHYTVNPYDVYSYDEMKQDIAELQKLYPQLISVFSIGQSAEGRDIPAFTFGKGDKKVILCGAMHAREYIATIFLMYMVDRYAYSYVKDEWADGYSVRKALESITFVVVPMMNPDGTNIVQNGFDAAADPEYVSSLPITEWGGSNRWESWKSNARGVDLNQNYPAKWEFDYEEPSSAHYGGPYENSEPETQAMVNLINQTDFEILASFHSQGQVIYWMDDICGGDLKEKFSPYITRICNETGFLKMPATSSTTSGNLTDYVRIYKRKMAMTIELCEYVGNYPYPEYDFDNVARPVYKIGALLADIANQL